MKACPYVPRVPSLKRLEALPPRDRILAAVSGRDHVIDRQALVMELAMKVLAETAIEKAVQLLVEATYKVANCDRVSLFLMEDDHLVCHAAPAGGEIGWNLPLGHGIAGMVGDSGQTMNIPDAYECSSLFDNSFDIATGYRTVSILCMPLKDPNGAVIGVLEAINKKDDVDVVRSELGSRGTSRSRQDYWSVDSLDDWLPFDAADERGLQLLLALTSQQLRLCSLVAARERAVQQANTQMVLLQDICRHRDIDTTVVALAEAVTVNVSCQQAFIFIKEGTQGDLVCRAAHPLKKAIGLRKSKEDFLFGDVGYLGKDVLISRQELTPELFAVQGMMGNEADAEVARRMSGTSLNIQVGSALAVPIRGDGDSDNDEIVGVAIAINKMVTLSDLALEDRTTGTEQPGTIPRRKSSTGAAISMASIEAQALSSLLHSRSGERCDYFEEVQFDESDMHTLRFLLKTGGKMVKTSYILSREQRTTKKLGALLTLLSACSSALEHRDMKQLVLLLSSHSRDIFECDRCTFFMVDHFTGMLIGHFVTEETGQAKELRLPMKGVVGVAATEGKLLNITDAWNNPLFSNANDVKTGYRTKTILCAPLKTSTGKVIAVIQCINKTRDEFFSEEDEKILDTISTLLSDLVQRMSLETSYSSFIKTSDAIDAEVKDLFREYVAESAPTTHHLDDDDGRTSRQSQADSIAEGRLATKSSMQARAAEDVVSNVRSWRCTDYQVVAEDIADCLVHVKMHFDYFGLLEQIKLSTFETFVRCLKARYNSATAYHNWTHAYVTLHATFLIIDSLAFRGLLESEDVLGVLLAALGHDVEHPGFSNAFQMATCSALAMRYNDISVLENHHAAVTCSMIKNDEMNVFEHVQADVFRRIRKVIIESIIYTDMAKHQDTITWLESSHVNLSGLRERADKLAKEEGLRVCVAILHSADLVHTSLPWSVHLQMSKNVATEFRKQFLEEERLGLPTLAFMGKDPSNLPELAPIQTGFVQFVAMPLWKSLNACAQEDLLKFVVDNVDNNRRNWQSLADGEELSQEQPFNLPPETLPAEGRMASEACPEEMKQKVG